MWLSHTSRRRKQPTDAERSSMSAESEKAAEKTGEKTGMNRIDVGIEGGFQLIEERTSNVGLERKRKQPTPGSIQEISEDDEPKDLLTTTIKTKSKAMATESTKKTKLVAKPTTKSFQASFRPQMEMSARVVAAINNMENDTENYPNLLKIERVGDASTTRFKVGNIEGDPDAPAYMQVRKSTAKATDMTIFFLRKLQAAGGQGNIKPEEIEFMDELDPSEWLGLQLKTKIKAYAMAESTKEKAKQRWRQYLVWVCLKHEPADRENVKNPTTVKKTKRTNKDDSSIVEDDTIQEDSPTEEDRPRSSNKEQQRKTEEKSFREKHGHLRTDVQLWKAFNEHCDEFDLTIYACERLARAWEEACSGDGQTGPRKEVLRRSALQATQQGISVSATMEFRGWRARAGPGNPRVKDCNWPDWEGFEE